ncbi:MAG: LytTR family DNA-binding domain-containing protein [Sulfitobacter sp.]
MSFTLRENRSLFTLIGIWVLVTALATVTGPFGTQEHLTLLPRFAYWATVAALSVGGSHLAFTTEKPRTIWLRGLLWVLYILPISILVFFLNMAVFDAWVGWGFFFYLLGSVTLIVAIVHGAIWLIDLARPDRAAEANDDPLLGFLRRIPLAQRGPLIRIEAQDHYLNVITNKGSALILLRLNEAVAELGKVNGLQVHRSHWIYLDAVMDHRRSQGRDLLVMSDGTEVPVSRSYRDAARAAGLF